MPLHQVPAAIGDGRLDSWKEIATYVRRDVTTVRRWEKREGLPVHRHLHDQRESVYAFKREIDAWWQGRLNQPGGKNRTIPVGRKREWIGVVDGGGWLRGRAHLGRGPSQVACGATVERTTLPGVAPRRFRI